MDTIDNSKKTAHQLWCDLLTSELVGALDHSTISTSAKSRVSNAVHRAVNFETTRIRCLTYSITDLLDATDRRAAEIKAEHVATPWWRFAKQRRLEQQHKDQCLLQEAYKKAVLVVVNTPPPSWAERVWIKPANINGEEI